jgi:DNA-binding transcriptional regulator YbjK
MALSAIPGGELGLPQSELRRRSILDAALRVVAAGGVEAVTHRRVAAKAGVPLGSTTYYFASRDDLLREAFRHHAAAVYGAVDAIADEVPLRGPADVVAFLVAMVRRELESRELIVVEYELIVRAARDPLLAREVAAYERNLAARLAEGLERLGVAQSLDAARTLVALVRGFEIDCLTHAAPPLETLRARLELVLAALAPDGRSALASQRAKPTRPRQEPSVPPPARSRRAPRRTRWTS